MNPRTLQGRLSCLMFLILAVSGRGVFAQAGHLDPSFGNGGIVTTDFGDQQQSSNSATANAVTIQTDGKIVVAGAIPNRSGFSVPAVARYNSNGSLDTTFGSGGIAAVTSLEDIAFTSLALQSDGKIVAVAGGFSASVVRYTASGVLDSTFGSGGIVTLRFINGTSPSGVAIQPDGRILVADNYLFRFLSDGQFDTSFGNGGTAKTAQRVNALALLPSGKILAASSFGSSGFLSQYEPNGSLDTTFAIGGQVASTGGTVAVVPLSSGDVLTGGSLTNGALPAPQGSVASGFTISRYSGVGVADATFGINGGGFTLVPGYTTVSASGLALEPDGDGVLVGTASLQSQAVFALTRYTSSGQLDTTFGNQGTAITIFDLGAVVSANGLTVQPDGKIVVVGSYSKFVPFHGFDTAFKVLRYLGH